MPVNPTYPGVYIEEIPSGVRTITGVATSITAFIGRTLRGSADKAVRIQSFADFERVFGGLWTQGMVTYAVQQFFLNGGTDAIIVRVHHNDAQRARLDLSAGGGLLQLAAASPGAWGSKLCARVDHDTRTPEPGEALFNLFVKDMDVNTAEEFRNLSLDPNHPRFIIRVLEQQSQLVRVTGGLPSAIPDPHALIAPGEDPFAATPPSPNYNTVAQDGLDGSPIDANDVMGDPATKTGIYALDNADIFNLLCLPPLTPDVDMPGVVYAEAITYCSNRRAILVLDPPSGWTTVESARTGVDTDFAALARHKNAVLYFPRIRMPDPLRENRLETFVPCGAVAGIVARTDASRGVWKAPAGQEAGFVGVRELSVKMTDPENGQLNPVAINCLRTFPVIGNVVWGARTLRGADQLADEWKYVPVRRTALFIEESLYRGTQWAVFEPNDEPLWAQLRLNVGSFMQDLFRKGAFQGSTPREAYLVKCDKETTTQNDINLGIVNILVGFAPLKPAEFVIIKIQQLAGNVNP